MARDILRWIILSLNHQPNQLSRAFMSRRTFSVSPNFYFRLSTAVSGTHNGPQYEYLDAVLSRNQKLGDTVFVRLDIKARES